MNSVLDTLAAAPGRAMQARSLFLWRLILGTPNPELGQSYPDAGPALRRLATPLVQLPPGAEVAPGVTPIGVAPEGFDLQPDILPGADGVFAFVATPGLRLAVSGDLDDSTRFIRRLQVLNAEGAPHRRTGAERFMLRYHLDRGVLAAQDVVFLSVTRGAPLPEGEAPRPPPLHVWIEIDHGTRRQFVVPVETRSGMLSDTDMANLTSFAPGALPDAVAGGDVKDVMIYVEFTGEVIDVRLMGEQLLY